MVLVVGVEGGGVGIAARGYAHDADDAGLIAVGVVKEGQVPGGHGVAQHVARLVIAYAVPGFRAAGALFQVIDAEFARL